MLCSTPSPPSQLRPEEVLPTSIPWAPCPSPVTWPKLAHWMQGRKLGQALQRERASPPAPQPPLMGAWERESRGAWAPRPA